jgi:hypothetical protein
MSTPISGRIPNTGSTKPVSIDESGRLLSDQLGRPQPGLALTIDGTAASARGQFGASTTRITLRNTGEVAATYKLGDVTVTATATDDHIGPGERLDILVRPGEYIAVLGAVIKISQLGA